MHPATRSMETMADTSHLTGAAALASLDVAGYGDEMDHEYTPETAGYDAAVYPNEAHESNAYDSNEYGGYDDAVTTGTFYDEAEEEAYAESPYAATDPTLDIGYYDEHGYYQYAGMENELAELTIPQSYNSGGDTAYEGDGTYDGEGYAYDTTNAYDPDWSTQHVSAGYEYDPNAPTSPFGDETYWQQYGEDAVDDLTETAASLLNPDELTPHGATALPSDDAAGTADDMLEEAVSGMESHDTEATRSVPATSATPSAESRAGTPSANKRTKKKGKGRHERVQRRQEQLEKGEEERARAQEAVDEGATLATATGHVAGDKTATKTRDRGVTRPPTLLERQRARINLKIRKACAIARKRIPVQLRVFTATRTQLSPLEKYFGGSVEPVLSDLFWAAIKGDLRRVRFLVEIEKTSVTDSKFDPWGMQQTPLHWAAKGGSQPVIAYLLAAGANPRCLDENGSLPLHLSCWAGHIDATLALVRATDTKDLYIQDYDTALAPLDWVNIRGHTALLKAISNYEDKLWLPKFVEDLVRGIIRYKIKVFKETPKSPTRGLNFRRPIPTKDVKQGGDPGNPTTTTGAATQPAAESKPEIPPDVAVPATQT